ncbi:F-box domain-containing protein [Mollisia scopiformis]|uniref:F-box domain-containing protein n=1 Tax=Mollisia scopiformis TaxID=149040 RepID=A0A194X239_MOLSC|nr:F-box domain-containing protein [Mollisia scopiformis]KUJ14064.1 F-box domain-containing protein [Mollisia scopiformis]
MSPCIFSCVLCGYVICDYENPTSWLKQFRILYSSRERIAITGVGLYNDPDGGDWIAPLNFAARWDDAGYNSPTHDQIGVIRQHPVNDRYGFPFHEACWSLLEKAHSPESIPCKALFEVCRSLPFPSEGTGLSWGHDFEGLVLVDNQDRYSWEDRFVDRSGDWALFLGARNDPYHVPEIQQLPDEYFQAPPAISSFRPVTTVVDCFAALPEEIRIAIASNLPTVDALNTRRASRSFLSIFYNQQFWASRFRANADRSWLFESQEWGNAHEWRWLYRLTNKSHRTRGMQNRERVWKLIQRVRGTLPLRWIEPSVLPSPSPIPASLRWLEATGDLRLEERTRPYHGFNEGCRLFYEQQTSIPTLLSQIAFSVIRLGDAEYITGMRLIPSQGEVIQLGYRTEGRERFLDIKFLAGFNFGRKIKRHTRYPMHCRRQANVTMVWMSVWGSENEASRGFWPYNSYQSWVRQCVLLATEKAIEESKSLRDSAFWYPEIPGIGLYLNDNCFVARDSSTARYQPLCWTMFGGLGGIYLRHLTGISVTCLGTLRGIEFHYNTEDVPIECRKLGRYRSSKYAKVIHFSIDGPAGEVIDAIEVYLRYFVGENVLWFYKHGALESFKISTNRGRSCHFRQEESAMTDNFVEKPIMIAPGTTINWFYWSQHENSLTAVGAILEVIGEEHRGASLAK